MDEEPVVSYTLRELLGEMNERLGRIEEHIAGKADASVVYDLATRVRKLEDANLASVSGEGRVDKVRETHIALMMAIVATVALVVDIAFHVFGMM